MQGGESELVAVVNVTMTVHVCDNSVEDAGRFTCVAENDAGQATMDIELVVHGQSSFRSSRYTSSVLFAVD